jgi:hypothetical protein
MKNNIPKIIWQTYKTDYEDLPTEAKNHSMAWRNLNPEYQYAYMNDEEMYAFTEKIYGKEMLDLMKSFKVNVMKADLWRVLVTYHFGGVYADIDTYPKVPLREWIDLDKNFIVAIENDLHYTQWVFMAAPKSPILKSVIDTIVERCQNIDYDMPEFVHYHTANRAFSEGIRKYLGLPNINHDCPTWETTKNCYCGYLRNEALGYEKNQKIIDEGFFCFSGEDWNTFRDGRIYHSFGSQNWKDSNYDRWVANPLAAKSRGNK